MRMYDLEMYVYVSHINLIGYSGGQHSWRQGLTLWNPHERRGAS